MRRRAVFGLALLAHAAFIGGMLRSRVSHERPREGGIVEATIWLPPLALVREAPTPTAAPTTPRRSVLRSIPYPVSDSKAIQAPELESRPLGQAAIPPASAASAPLDLTLSRAQLRAVIAGSRPTLGQGLARPGAPSALASLGGDEAAYVEKPLPGGEAEVHVHDGCFRTVPTPRSQYDAFNHGGERLTAACK